MIAIILAIAALLSQWPAATHDALTYGEVIQTEGFLGVEWICEGQPGYAEFGPTEYIEQALEAGIDPLELEVCYAGLSYSEAGTMLIVGP